MRHAPTREDHPVKELRALRTHTGHHVRHGRRIPAPQVGQHADQRADQEPVPRDGRRHHHEHVLRPGAGVEMHAREAVGAGECWGARHVGDPAACAAAVSAGSTHEI